MVEPPWKRLDTSLIVPDVVEMIKSEFVEMECGWELGGSGV